MKKRHDTSDSNKILHRICVFAAVSVFIICGFAFTGLDLILIVLWWFPVFIIGLIFTPVAARLFNRFYDRGYMFAKTLGIAVVSYLVWLLSSLRILSFGIFTILACLLAVFVIICVFCRRNRRFDLFPVKNSRVIFYEEMMFLCGIALWSYIRGHNPDIYGLEKYMDFGFVNSIMRTDFMPPADMWFAGDSINYYYYGHYICAFLAKLTPIGSDAAYNLMMATIFSLTLCLTFSLVSGLAHLSGGQKPAKYHIAGIVSSIFLTFGGNLHTLIYAVILPFAKFLGIYNGNTASYWYADATRYIGYNPPTEDRTIHEFPLYSFVVSDLHGHVSNIPFVLTLLAVLLAFIVNISETRRIAKASIPGKKPGNRYITAISSLNPAIVITAAFLLAVFYMTNTWDYPIYIIVTALVFLCGNIAGRSSDGIPGIKPVLSACAQVLAVFAISMLFIWPFSTGFTAFTEGIGLVHSNTPFYQFIVLWGVQFFLVLAFAVFILLTYKKTGISHTDVFILVLAMSAVGLTLAPEIIYIKDIYTGSYYRANTMFKMSYQAFIMFGVTAGYIFFKVFHGYRGGVSYAGTASLYAGILRYALPAVVALPLLYPFYAVKGFYGSMSPSAYKGLNGLGYLERTYPGDYKAVQWFNSCIPGQPVILEANGDSYSDYGRISASTGLPTIQGWAVHEWLWRGGYDVVSRRAVEVAEVYQSDDINATKRILKKYNVSYVVIGQLERKKFAGLREEKLLKLGMLVYKTQDMKIIRVKF